jgi:hypothetical protein
MRPSAPILLLLWLIAPVGVPAAAPAGGEARVLEQYTFSWPLGPDVPRPRGGTTRGAPVRVDAAASPAWLALQAPGLSAQERDRRAILAMAGSYRVTFDFLEIAAFAPAASRAQPYQSWGTERVFVDADEPGHVSLVHILEMRIVDAQGKVSEPMVTRHWRQDWRYEPDALMEYAGGTRWTMRKLGASERRGVWTQTVYQVDESPRYGAIGRWEHNKDFSTWISADTARPLPRREWSQRKDYELLQGTNRHTILPGGWLQEENNLKQARAAAQSFVAREYGVARYQRLDDAQLEAAGREFVATRMFWGEVVAAWQRLFARQEVVELAAHSDRSGAYAAIFALAEQFASDQFDATRAAAQIDAEIGRQLAAVPKAAAPQEQAHVLAKRH